MSAPNPCHDCIVDASPQPILQAAMRRALITRNNPRAVKVMHERHFADNPFKPALSRDFRPYKPHPAALQHICKQWEAPPAEVVMIGDSAGDDVRPLLSQHTSYSEWSGTAAGRGGGSMLTTCLLYCLLLMFSAGCSVQPAVAGACLCCGCHCNLVVETLDFLVQTQFET